MFPPPKGPRKTPASYGIFTHLGTTKDGSKVFRSDGNQEPDLVRKIVDQAPLNVAWMDKLGIRQVIDKRLAKHALAMVSDTAMIEAMEWDEPYDNVGHWRVDEGPEHLDFPLLFREGAEARHFNDTRW